MGCDHTYRNPAGLKFVTRAEYTGGTPLYANALAGETVLLNIPNGAGPGTLYLGTHDTYATWTVRDVKNLVRQTQRAYTGAASFEQLWVEDGCIVSVSLLDRDSLSHYDDDGIVRFGNPQSRIFAEWFPANTAVPSFTRLSLLTGGLGTANPYPLRTLTSGNQILQLVPPGLCRFISVSSTVPLVTVIRNVTPATNILYETIGPFDNFTRCIPAWGVVEVQGPAQGNSDVSVCWNRFPMIGS